MSEATLLLGDEAFTVQIQSLIAKCNLFATNACLVTSPYRVNCVVPPAVFRLFLDAIEGRDVTLTNANITSLAQLSGEFGFRSFSSKLSSFHMTDDVSATIQSDTRIHLCELEELVSQQERRLVRLEALCLRFVEETSRLRTNIQSLRGRVETTQQRRTDSSEEARDRKCVSARGAAPTHNASAAAAARPVGDDVPLDSQITASVPV
jgi:hypothetical protein